jgi:hypothetical protein
MPAFHVAQCPLRLPVPDEASPSFTARSGAGGAGGAESACSGPVVMAYNWALKVVVKTVDVSEALRVGATRDRIESASALLYNPVWLAGLPVLETLTWTLPIVVCGHGHF